MDSRCAACYKVDAIEWHSVHRTHGQVERQVGGYCLGGTRVQGEFVGARISADSHRVRRKLPMKLMNRDERVVEYVAGDQRLDLLVPRSSLLLLVVLLAQQLVLPWSNSSGTGTASGGVLENLACCVGV